MFIPDLTIREGRCQRIDNDYHQKGVDTLFVMELLDLCRNKDIKTFVLLACDSDFVPLLQRMRSEGFKIILFYLMDKERKSKFNMSNNILTACDEKILITENYFLRSIKNKNLTNWINHPQ